jgi:hypothetical protein
MEFLVTLFHQKAKKRKRKKASAVLPDCKWTERPPVTEKNQPI